MVIYFVMVCALGFLFAVSAGEEVPADIKIPRMRMPFYRVGYYLAEKWNSKKGGGSNVRKETEKLANTVMILFLGLGVSLLAQGTMIAPGLLTEHNQVIRPNKGEGDKTIELQAQFEGMEETEDMRILVAERQYTYDEKQEFLTRAMEQIEDAVLGENHSPDEVRKQIFFPSQMLDGQVSVQWIQQPEGLLDEEGRPLEELPKEGELLQLRAMLACEDQKASYEMALHVYPPLRNEREQLVFSLKKKIKAIEEESLEKDTLTLPDEVEGQAVIWTEPKTSMAGTFLAMTILAAVVSYLGKEQEFRQEKIKRQRQLVMDYPNLLFKLSMLLNAGLTMQNAFSRIAFAYRDGKHKQVRYAYEEMLVACYEMRSGISEVQAYENFGKRCGQNLYVKLGATLAGNLQKGAQGLTKLLEEEALEAMDERRQLAKKLGEEAGTKLLLPMVLMLMIVLVILMLPAVMSF